MRQKINNMIAIMLAIIILCASSYAVVSYAADTYKSAAELESQGASTNDKNVEVDVYYAGGEHSKTVDITKTEKIYAKVVVKNAGYLENLTINFANSNFEIANDESNAEKIQSIDTKNKVVVLNKIVAGNEVEIALNISPIKTDVVGTDNFKNDNTITVSGTYVNEKAKEVAISKEIAIHTSWHGEAKTKINQEIVKYIPSVLGEEVLLQTEVTTEVENSVLPVKNSEVIVDIPELAETKPTKVMVYAKTTENTNGEKTAISFNESNYSYDETNGEIVIKVANNANAEGKISWVKNAQDKYEIVMVYPKEVIAALKESTSIIQTSASITNEYYDDVDYSSNAGTTAQTPLSQKGTIADYEGGIENESIAKGYMYNGVETTYTEKYSMSTSYAGITDEMNITVDTPEFVKESGETVSSANNIYNKKVSVDIAELKKILGETGKVEIISNSKVIGTIDANTEVDSNGKATVDISAEKASSIEVKTSKPQTQGQLSVEIEKAIASDISYSLAERKIFTGVKQVATGIAKAGEEQITTAEVTDTMNLVEPTAKGTININKDTLSTVVSNDVEITALLETDSADDSLYENPTISIKLPSYISSVNLKKSELLHTDELQIAETKIVDGTNGKEIQVSLNGTQTKYSDTVTKGAKVLIYADFIVDKTTPSVDSEIEMSYTNNINSAKVKVSFNAPTGLVTINNYASGDNSVTVLDSEKGIVNLDLNAQAKTATIKGEIINNYNNTISATSILGRIAKEDSIKYDSTEKVGNTFDLSLTGAIVLTGAEEYTIYYSENAGANKELSDSSNGWTTSVTDYSKVKSYLIVINNEIAKAQDISWSYNVSIPANLGYKNSATNNYKVYLQNNLESGMVNENKESAQIIMQTENGPELEASITSVDVENGGTVTNGKRILFNFNINNTGSKSLSNLKVKIPVPEGMKYNYGNKIYDYDKENNILTANIETIEANEQQSLELYLVCAQEGSTKVSASITSDSFNGILEPEPISFTIEKADIALINMPISNEENVMIGQLGVKNLTSEEIKNIEIKYILPEGIQYKDYSVEGDFECEVKYNEKENIVSIKLKALGVEESKNIFIRLTTDLNENKELYTMANATVNGKEYTSNREKITIKNYDYMVTATNPGDQYVKTDDEISSVFTIENTCEDSLNLIKLNYKIPSGTEFVSGNIEYNGKTYTLAEDIENEGEVNYTLVKLYKGEKATATINLKVTMQESDKEQEITSSITTSNDVVGEKKSETLTFIMKAKKEDNPENGINNEVTNVEPGENNEIIDPGDDKRTGKEINGKVWVDSNKNGKYDEGESRLSGITVLLISKVDGNVKLTTTTNENGRYTFDKLENGSYLVAFLYDSSKYVVTEYQKEGVSKTVNSDAIDATINYKGEDKKVGLTDTIEILDSDVNNIDIGIYEAEKFDLSLNKYVSKVTVNNNSGVTTYDYNGKDKTLVKVDIPAKYMSSSTVIIEYKIQVKNEGEVPGYAKKVVDYIPDGLKFNTELNPKAYLGKDGNIYSEELADTIINPGESKEITIILTKKMTDTNTGTVVNEAEIAESYNELGLEDINSEPGNKDEKENDLGSASTIITVKTGQIVIYTTLIVGVIAMLTVGSYMIKKYVI